MDNNGKNVFLRPDEAAKLLSVSRAKAYALIASGELPCIRLGKRGVRVPRAAIEKLVADAMGGGEPAAR